MTLWIWLWMAEWQFGVQISGFSLFFREWQCWPWKWREETLSTICLRYSEITDTIREWLVSGIWWYVHWYSQTDWLLISWFDVTRTCPQNMFPEHVPRTFREHSKTCSHTRASLKTSNNPLTYWLTDLLSQTMTWVIRIGSAKHWKNFRTTNYTKSARISWKMSVLILSMDFIMEISFRTIISAIIRNGWWTKRLISSKLLSNVKSHFSYISHRLWLMILMLMYVQIVHYHTIICIDSFHCAKS